MLASAVAIILGRSVLRKLYRTCRQNLLNIVICLSGGLNLAHSKSAKKSIRIYKEKRSRNRSIKSALKTGISQAEKLILEGEIEPATEAVKKATTALDKAAQKGVIHVNNAARHKSRLIRKLNKSVSSES